MFQPDLPVMTRPRIMHQNGKTIYYPEIIGLQNIAIQQQMNHTIFKATENLMNQQYKEQQTESFAQMLGTYEIKTNERGILSLTLSNYAIFEQAAHGLTLMDSLTFNVKTGKLYTLGELFKPESNYVKILSEIIKKQIKQRGIPTLNDFTAIDPNQFYYIADKALVIYFQIYDITPYYIGLPMFPISVFDIEDIIRDGSPLDIMATNN